MRAARFHGARDVRIDDVPAPDPNLEPSQVLVAPRFCGICGSDLHEYLRGPQLIPVTPHPLTGARAPQIIGHEFSGDVEAVGADVTKVRPGDRVSIMPLICCGECYECRHGLKHLCTRIADIGQSAAWGGFATQAALEEYQVSPLPSALSYEQGALIEPAAVAVAAVERSGMRPGDSVLITGAGPIGALCALAARAAGASQVIVSEPNLRRSARIESFASATIIDPTSTDLAAELREITGGRGADVSLECAGSAAALADCIAATKARGTIALIGLHLKPTEIELMKVMAREISLVGVMTYAISDWPRIAGKVESGVYPIERIVTSKIHLEEIVPKGFEALADPGGEELKILVDLSERKQDDQ
jgi:(R,R)-butanediol dehydrogenase / meso-butanediol dehydrogenase / diacetyl reductase